MANTNLSFTGRDAVDIRQQLNNLGPNLTDKWKDFSESDLGEVIIDLIAGIQDYQNFYLDTQVFETYLDTAQQDKNIRSLLRAMNYRIPAIGSAKGEIHLTFLEEVPENIENGYFTIPKYTKVSNKSNNKVCYLTQDAVKVFPGTIEVDIPVIEGTLRTMSVTRKSLENNTTLSGEVSRRIYLSGGDSSKYADKSVEIIQGQGVIWKEVDDAILEYDGGTLYSVHQDSNGETYILMSVDFINYLPVDPTEEVVITWIQSLGTEGVVDKGVLNTFNKLTDWSNKPITVTNLTKTYGAYDTPDLSKLKVLARRQAQTLGRYITLDDYKNGVDTEPYVFKSVVKDWKSRQYVASPYIVKVWAVDTSNKDLGEQDVKALRTKLMSKGTTDIDVQYMPTDFVKIRMDISLELKVSTSSNMTSLENLARNYVDELYSLGNLDYAYRISILNLASGIRGLSSYIRSVDVKLYTASIEGLTSSSYNVSSMVEALNVIASESGVSSEAYQNALSEYIDEVTDMVKSDYTELEAYDRNDITSLSDLNVITWNLSGDIALDEIEFPVIYQVNVKSYIEGESYDL